MPQPWRHCPRPGRLSSLKPLQPIPHNRLSVTSRLKHFRKRSQFICVARTLPFPVAQLRLLSDCPAKKERPVQRAVACSLRPDSRHLSRSMKPLEGYTSSLLVGDVLDIEPPQPTAIPPNIYLAVAPLSASSIYRDSRETYELLGRCRKKRPVVCGLSRARSFPECQSGQQGGTPTAAHPGKEHAYLRTMSKLLPRPKLICISLVKLGLQLSCQCLPALLPQGSRTVWS